MKRTGQSSRLVWVLTRWRGDSAQQPVLCGMCRAEPYSLSMLTSKQSRSRERHGDRGRHRPSQHPWRFYEEYAWRDRDGYDRDGLDRFGSDRRGYDVDGFDKDGRNRDGLDRSGRWAPPHQQAPQGWARRLGTPRDSYEEQSRMYGRHCPYGNDAPGPTPPYLGARGLEHADVASERRRSNREGEFGAARDDRIPEPRREFGVGMRYEEEAMERRRRRGGGDYAPLQPRRMMGLGPDEQEDSRRSTSWHRWGEEDRRSNSRGGHRRREGDRGSSSRGGSRRREYESGGGSSRGGHRRRSKDRGGSSRGGGRRREGEDRRRGSSDSSNGGSSDDDLGNSVCPALRGRSERTPSQPSSACDENAM